jgi:FkbM family methyltransferase
MENSLSEIATRYGILAVPDDGSDIIVRHLTRYGEWAWNEVCFIASVLPMEGARVLDVGGFVGTFGIGLSQLRNLRSLCFVEANANAARLLEQNVAQIFLKKGKKDSGLSPVVVEAMVAAPDTPLLPGYASPNNLGATSFLPSGDGKEIVTAPPPKRSVTLAALQAEHGDFDLIKLDAEGMELDILRSDTQVLSQGKGTLWIECNEDPRSLELMDYLISRSLDIYYFAFPAHNPENMHHDSTPIFPFAYEAGLLVAPKMPPMLDARLQAQGCILRSVVSVQDLKDALWRTPRWGRREWTGATPEEIVALAGRSLQGESYEKYLQPGVWSPNLPVLDVTTQINTFNHLAQAHLEELEAERRRAIQAEELLAGTSSRELDILARLGESQEEGLDLKNRLSLLSAQLEESRNQLEESRNQLEESRKKGQDYKHCLSLLESSLSWRLTKPLREHLGRNSRLSSWLRIFHLF